MWRKALVAAPLAAALVMLVSAQAWAAGPISGVSGTASPSHFFWYLSRTSAMLAYILLFINIVLGLGLKTRFLDKLTARWLSFDLHQFTALLAISLIFLHVFTLLGDKYLSPHLQRSFDPFLRQLPAALDSSGDNQFLSFNHYYSDQLFAALDRPQSLARDSSDFLHPVLCHSLPRPAQRNRHFRALGPNHLSQHRISSGLSLSLALSAGRPLSTATNFR